VDLNRAGTPLLEIVSEPDMHSAAEAKAYARELYLRMKYADVSEANLYYGNMRFDVNVSVSKSGDMGTRTETKNLNSFRSVEKAVEYEVNRQIDVLESGDKVIQETRGWDDNALKTFSQRTKEDAHDYRYFPDPDLPPVTITDEFITQIKADMPELPNDYRAKFKEIGLTTEVVEDIVAIPESAMTVSRILAKSNAEHARRVAFWLMQPASDDVDGESTGSKATDEALIGLSEMVSANKLSSTAAKQVLTELLANGGNPEEIADSKNLIQESDEGAIAEIVAKVIADNPKAAEDVKNGEMKAIGFLTGQVMKLSQGKANPSMAQELIKKQLGL
jgi:aspartyl-tRNA(Asn)/glutamyl-tRNA(Gln) amidotransferase subunit B